MKNQKRGRSPSRILLPSSFQRPIAAGRQGCLRLSRTSPAISARRMMRCCPKKPTTRDSERFAGFGSLPESLFSWCVRQGECDLRFLSGTWRTSPAVSAGGRMRCCFSILSFWRIRLRNLLLFFRVKIMPVPILAGRNPKDAFEGAGEMKLVVVSHRTADLRHGNLRVLQ